MCFWRIRTAKGQHAQDCRKTLCSSGPLGLAGADVSNKSNKFANKTGPPQPPIFPLNWRSAKILCELAASGPAQAQKPVSPRFPKTFSEVTKNGDMAQFPSTLSIQAAGRAKWRWCWSQWKLEAEWTWVHRKSRVYLDLQPNWFEVTTR